MTNEELIADLKQFIEATVSQQAAQLEQRMDSLETRMATKDDINGVEQRLSARIDTLDEKLDLIQDAIAETVTDMRQATNAKLEDHEQRLRRLEHRAA